MDPLRQTFFEEAGDLLDRLDDALLDVEADPSDPAAVQGFLGAAHTLKGASATIGLADVAALAHAMEEAMDELRHGDLEPSPPLFDCLGSGQRALVEAVAALPSGTPAAEPLRRVRTCIESSLVRGGSERTGAERTRGDVVLGEYDLVRLRTLEHQGQRLYDVRLVPRGASGDDGWAIGLLKLLLRHGAVVATQPPADGLDGADPCDGVRAILGSRRSSQELTRLLRGDAHVIVRPYVRAGAAASPAAVPTSCVATERSARVELAVLDDLGHELHDLVTCQPRLEAISAGFASHLGDTALARDVARAAGEVARLAGHLHEEILRCRLVPVARLYRLLRRHVRQAARDIDRPVPLALEGGDVLVDAAVAAALAEPLGRLAAALVRSAEDPAEGLQARACSSGSAVRFDLTMARSEATAPAVREAIGGITATGAHLSALGNATFRITVPVTRTVMAALLMEVGDETYALPVDDVQEALHLRRAELRTVTGGPVVELRGEPLRLLPLRERLGAATRVPDEMDAVVLSRSDPRVGFLVDRLVGRRDIVVKPLARRIPWGREVSACTVLPDGRVGLILDAEGLLAPRVGGVA